MLRALLKRLQHMPQPTGHARQPFFRMFLMHPGSYWQPTATHPKSQSFNMGGLLQEVRTRSVFCSRVGGQVQAHGCLGHRSGGGARTAAFALLTQPNSCATTRLKNSLQGRQLPTSGLISRFMTPTRWQ